MNQGIAFARTLRALDADDFRASKLGLLVAAILLAAWTWWMIAARVPQYESSSNVRLEAGRAIAYFVPEAISRIHAGQPAVIHVGNVSFSSRVESVASDRIDCGVVRGTPTSVDVEVSRLSPVALALR